MTTDEGVPILVVVPFFNPGEFLTTCLESIQAQRYPNVRVVVADDASTDDHAARTASGLARMNGWEYVRSDRNRKMPCNLWETLRCIPGDADEIVVLVDGDDWLPHSDVLTRIAGVYEDPDVWLTWGSYTRWPDPDYSPNPAVPYPPEVAAANGYRDHGYEAFNHPLTFRRFLWDAVPETDLRDDNGRWFTVGYDKVIMFPMLELSGPAHQKFLPEILYVYNEGNPISEVRDQPNVGAGITPTLARRARHAPLDRSRV